ncbi:hypothetical protein PVBG_05568 [Plasmodium vivax Brazil I]|uniref:Variable surface protein Vir12 n=1 Tax=Plasmodium vivax (strain Brazil I) TaxID=1033975 RepID=A0A0J9T293_PLAV1|nr:hypothetical protein PVBG_05568 [Plasmodium vivax Brazil I]
MATQNKKNWDYVLKGSASFELYDEFNKEVPDEKKINSNDCNEFKSTSNGYKKEAYELCKKIIRNLNNLHDIVVPETRRYNCLHYKYWINNELINIFKNDSETKYDIDMIKKFLNMQDTFNNEKKYYSCKYDINKINLEYLQEMSDRKDLNDYFNNYNTIKKNIKCGSGKVDTFEEYVNHIKGLYDKYKKNCWDHFDYWLSDCRSYFRRGEEYDPNILLSNLKCDSENRTGEQANRGGTGSVKYVPKKRMTFHYLKCKDNAEKKPIMCALVPVTMEYKDDKVEVKENNKAVRKGIPKPPDPWSTFGGILHKKSEITAQSLNEGVPNDSQVDSDVPGSDPSNSEFLTEADGVSPYLVLTDDEIKWRILDYETLDCRNYASEDTYGLCKRLNQLHQEGKFKSQPKPSSYNETSRGNFSRGVNSLNAVSYDMEEDYENSSNTSDDILLLLDPGLEIEKEGKTKLLTNILNKYRKNLFNLFPNR